MVQVSPTQMLSKTLSLSYISQKQTKKQMVLYMTAQNSSFCRRSTSLKKISPSPLPSTQHTQHNRTVAYAGFCILDQYDRPIAGHINICPIFLQDIQNPTITDEQWDDYTSILLHESRYVLLVFCTKKKKVFFEKKQNFLFF